MKSDMVYPRFVVRSNMVYPRFVDLDEERASIVLSQFPRVPNGLLSATELFVLEVAWGIYHFGIFSLDSLAACIRVVPKVSR